MEALRLKASIHLQSDADHVRQLLVGSSHLSCIRSSTAAHRSESLQWVACPRLTVACYPQVNDPAASVQ